MSDDLKLAALHGLVLTGAGLFAWCHQLVLAGFCALGVMAMHAMALESTR